MLKLYNDLSPYRFRSGLELYTGTRSATCGQTDRTRVALGGTPLKLLRSTATIRRTGSEPPEDRPARDADEDPSRRCRLAGSPVRHRVRAPRLRAVLRRGTR